MWYEGDREKNFVQFGRMEEDKNWGLKVGLVGMLLPMATLILVIFAKALNMPDLIVYYKLINPQINMLINLFIPTVDPSSFGVLQIILTACCICMYRYFVLWDTGWDTVAFLLWKSWYTTRRKTTEKMAEETPKTQPSLIARCAF